MPKAGADVRNEALFRSPFGCLRNAGFEAVSGSRRIARKHGKQLMYIEKYFIFPHPPCRARGGPRERNLSANIDVEREGDSFYS